MTLREGSTRKAVGTVFRVWLAHGGAEHPSSSSYRVEATGSTGAKIRVGRAISPLSPHGQEHALSVQAIGNVPLGRVVRLLSGRLGNALGML
jgi:hypothetical protein